jgi:cytochrome c biogenesis protein CcmG/thiol:disulfide interchange protein DsbE
MGGGEIRLSNLRGTALVVNLWATWCPPCRAEMPALENVYGRYKTKGLEILAVNMTSQDSEQAATAFAKELGLTFPVLFDRTGLVGNIYQLRAFPTTFFVDPEGIIQEVVVGGPMSEVTIESIVERLLQEAD